MDYSPRSRKTVKSQTVIAPLRWQFSSPTGGKAGRRNNKTATVQVFQDFGGGILLLKQFSFRVGNAESQAKAVEKAKGFISSSLPS